VSSGLPLLAGFAHESEIGYQHGAAIAAPRFCAAAHELAALLPKKRYVLNLCEDRLNFMLGFAAALIARQVSLLPPSRAAGAVRDIHAAYPEVYCLADHNDLPAGLPALMIPAWREGLEARDVPEISAEQIALIAFTSGSTGRPQPHAKTWGSLAVTGRALAKRLGIVPGADCAVLGTVPPQHMYGLETTIMLPMQAGVRVHAARPLLPADIGEALAELPGARWLATTPAHLRACIGEHAALSGLAGVICATMPLSLELVNRVECSWGATIHEIYGCTEAGTVALRRPAQSSIWRVCEGMRVRQEGEVAWVAGGHLDQALQLPDRIEVLSDELFILHGRPGDMAKIAGKRASLEALNNELLRIPGVQDGVFFVSDTAGEGEARLAALVVAPKLTRSAILRALRTRIDSAFLPRPLLLVEALPRNATGKVPQEGLVKLAAEALARESKRSA
jgi:acyl-coenzyme A synthetase/AMP-(fatty) acid ligase